MMRVIIPGSVPDGKKSLKTPPKTGKFFPSSKLEAWADNAVAEIRRQIDGLHLTHPASINILYYTGDQKRREPLVIMDTVLYALRVSGLVAHERLFGGDRGHQITFRHGGLNGRPRVELEIMA